MSGLLITFEGGDGSGKSTQIMRLAERLRMRGLDVRTFREEQAKKSISLNEAERRAERDKFDAQRKFRAAERKRLGIELDPLVEARADDGLLADERNVAESVAREQAAEKVTDPLLRASAAILGDAIGLLGKDAKLAAQVLPEARTAGHWVD